MAYYKNPTFFKCIKNIPSHFLTELSHLLLFLLFLKGVSCKCSTLFLLNILIIVPFANIPIAFVYLAINLYKKTREQQESLDDVVPHTPTLREDAVDPSLEGSGSTPIQGKVENIQKTRTPLSDKRLEGCQLILAKVAKVGGSPPFKGFVLRSNGGWSQCTAHTETSTRPKWKDINGTLHRSNYLFNKLGLSDERECLGKGWTPVEAVSYVPVFSEDDSCSEKRSKEVHEENTFILPQSAFHSLEATYSDADLLLAGLPLTMQGDVT